MENCYNRWAEDKQDDARYNISSIRTSPEDIHGMNAARGILTAIGGWQVMRQLLQGVWEDTCVSGSSEITIDYEAKLFKAKARY